MDRSDAFDVITDPDLSARTTSLKRAFALKLAAQVVYDRWYSFDDPAKLAAAIEAKEFLTEHGETPEGAMVKLLLEYNSSVDAKTLEVLRDVGVGAPQMGQLGIGAPIQPQAQGAPQAQRRGFFSRREAPPRS